jgi:hypothetical protein
LFSLPVTDSKHPGHHFFVESGFMQIVEDEVETKHITARAKMSVPKSTISAPPKPTPREVNWGSL